MKNFLILTFMAFVATLSWGIPTDTKIVTISPTSVSAHTIATLQPESTSTVGSSSAEIESPGSISTTRRKIRTDSLQGFSTTARVRFEKIVANTQEILNKKEFDQMVLDWYFKGKKQYHFTSDSPETVLKKITSKEWVLEYRLEWLWRSTTIGYTKDSVTWIVFNSRKWNSLSDAEISGNICHEYGGHKLGGYNHEKQHNKDRPYSVPYALGFICETLYRKFF